MQACGGCQQQTSSAMTGGDRGGGICGLMCARKWGHSAQACVHKFQKPEKRLAAIVPRCADVRIHKCRPRCMTAAGEALCGLTACEIRRYRRRRRALSLACGGAKGGAVSQSCAHKRTSSLGKQTAARAGGGRKQTLSAITGDDLDKIAHLRADGRLHTQARVHKRISPSVRDCGGRAAAKVYGRVKAGNIAASCASRRYRPSPPSAQRHSRAGGGRKRSAVRADIRAGVRQSTAARGYVCAAYFCTRLLLPSLWAQACGPADMRGGGRFRLCGGGFAVRRPLFCAGKRMKACNFVEKYRANRRACLTFHGNLCTIIKMEIFCPHEPCGRL